ncbi:TPA: [citrate (pro-3S)-lyase] ligase, partial [Citrobacter farmeri]|nr:[citrate (pro-3S)-lyase] ligase [Citrobacter farmeri]
FQETPISASLVRKLLVKKDLTAIASLVPSATLQYLQNMPERVPAHATVRQKPPALVTGEK